MRKIRFRGKRKDTGEWVYGDLLHIGGGSLIYFGSQKETEAPYIENGSPIAVELFKTEIAVVEPESVGQFTGFVDMAGQDVYEGDYLLTKGVLPSNEGELYCCPLVYHKDALCHFVHEIGAYLRLNKDNFDGDMMYTVAVGNIHDNPELQSGHTEDVKMLIKQIYGKYSRKCLFMSKKSDKKSDKKNLK